MALSALSNLTHSYTLVRENNIIIYSKNRSDMSK